MGFLGECMRQCARKSPDTADIVRDGDFSPTDAACDVGFPTTAFHIAGSSQFD